MTNHIPHILRTFKNTGRRFRKLLFYFALLVPLHPCATAQSLQETVQRHLGSDIKVKSIVETSSKGIFAVTTDNQIFYTDAKGEHFIFGIMVGARDAEARLKTSIRATKPIDPADLPIHDAVINIYGDGRRKVFVFSDPYCGFCQKLHRTVREAGNVTIYTFLIPVINSESRSTSLNIWCAKDRGMAWEYWIQNKRTEKYKNSCDTDKYERIVGLARTYSVSLVPTLFTSEGKRISGLPTPEQLKEAIN